MEHEVKFYVQREEADTTQYLVHQTANTTTAVSTRDLDRGPGRELLTPDRARSRSPRNREELEG